MKKQVNYFRYLIVAILSLSFIITAIAIDEGNPRSYYIFLKWFNCIAFIIAAIYFYRDSGGISPWFSGLIILIIMYNPFFPVRVGFSMWTITDFLTCFFIIILFWYIFYTRTKKSLS